jgi:hypothetical protein
MQIVTKARMNLKVVEVKLKNHSYPVTRARPNPVILSQNHHSTENGLDEEKEKASFRRDGEVREKSNILVSRSMKFYPKVNSHDTE